MADDLDKRRNSLIDSISWALLFSCFIQSVQCVHVKRLADAADRAHPKDSRP